MSATRHPVVRSGLLLGLIALLGTAGLVFVHDQTRTRIALQEQRRVLQQLNEIVPVSAYDNDLHTDRITITDPAFFHHAGPVTVYRARMDGRPVAVIMRITAPDGYNGDIHLLVGIDAAGTILGVRVTEHRETPGLGDLIEIAKSRWITHFKGTSLTHPQERGWAVRRDGGDFDQFTGATISPRAVVKAVHNALKYFQAQRRALFETPAKAAPKHD